MAFQNGGVGNHMRGPGATVEARYRRRLGMGFKLEREKESRRLWGEQGKEKGDMFSSLRCLSSGPIAAPSADSSHKITERERERGGALGSTSQCHDVERHDGRRGKGSVNRDVCIKRMIHHFTSFLSRGE